MLVIFQTLLFPIFRTTWEEVWTDEMPLPWSGKQGLCYISFPCRQVLQVSILKYFLSCLLTVLAYRLT